MRLAAGVRPPIGEAMGAYGSSRFSAVVLWLWSALLISNGVATQWQDPRVWMRAADLVLLAAVILLAIGRTFTPAVIISADAIRRRYRAPILWTEVVDVLPPSRLGKGMRLRLNDRAVIELPQVDAGRGDALGTAAGLRPTPPSTARRTGSSMRARSVFAISNTGSPG